MKRLIDKRLGTEVFVANRRLRCLYCGTLILWRSLLRRSWRYTACQSCEGFEQYMVEGTDGIHINPDHPCQSVPSDIGPNSVDPS